MRPWLLYTLVRIGVFAVVLAGLLVLGVEGWIAALIAAVVGLCVSYIFFAPLRRRVADDLATRRARPAADVDADVEDR